MSICRSCTLLFTLFAPSSSVAGPVGPSPYLSFADSPWTSQTFSYFHLEDFEDGVLKFARSVRTECRLYHAFRWNFYRLRRR